MGILKRTFGQNGPKGWLAGAMPVWREASPRVAAGTYLVLKGDSLWKIAKRVYGDAAKWQDIYEANRRRLKNPELVSPGMTLRLP